MHICVFKKESILTLFIIFLCIGILIGTATKKSKETSLNIKKIPIYAVMRNDKKIAVTFDVAWGNEDIDEILNVLKSHNATGTFFIVGEWAEKFPQDVLKIFNANNTIGNHSYSHKDFTKCSKDEIKKEITLCNEKLKSITNSDVNLLRVPSGAYSDDSISIGNSLDMYTIQWDVDSLDYRKLSVDEITKRVLNRVQSGSIILFHTGVKNTAAALDLCLTELEKQGYSFVSVNDLIYKENYTIDHTGRQKLNA